MTTNDQPAWAGFWRRVGAFVVDGVVIGLVGYLIGAASFDVMVRLGLAARLIGLALAMGYFGVLGSAIGDGQTLGKRLFKLRVESIGGHRLSLGRALGRAFVLSLPFVLNGVALKSQGGIVTYAFLVLGATGLFGLGLAQLYLLIFNRPSRRLVHDLLFDSVVLQTGSSAAVAPVAAVHRRMALGIVLGVFVLITGMTAYFTQASSGPIAALKGPLAAVEALPEVMSATIGDNTTVMMLSGSGKTTSHTRVINARLNTWPKDLNAEVGRIARAALAVGRPPPGWGVAVSLSYGFNMGFASGSKGYAASIPLADAPARALVGGKPS